MSINASSINIESVDALYGNRRSIIIADLIAKIPVNEIFKGHPQKVSKDSTVNLNIFRRNVDRDELDEEVDIKTLELPQITITVSMYGQDYSHTIERDNTVPMISVYAVAIKPSDPIIINISDIKIEVK